MVEAGKGTYQGKKESDLIDEKIDEVILRALGLDDVFDLDYDTYKTLLKERMMADRMGQKMDSGESGAVTDEYKRVKTKVGRFRLNKKKINVVPKSMSAVPNSGIGDFTGGGFIVSTTYLLKLKSTVPPTYLLTEKST